MNTTGPTSRTLARRAGVLLIVLATLGLLFGGTFVLFGLILPRVAGDPTVKPTIDQLRTLSPLEPRVFILVAGAVMLAYATAMLTVGVGSLRATRAWIVAALIVTGGVTAWMGFSVLVNLASGRPLNLFEPIVLAAHGLALRWLWRSLRDAPARASAPAWDWPVPPHRPMQEYYLPPAAPVDRVPFAAREAR